MRRRIRPLVEQLVSRAQEQGTLRPDFTPQGLPPLFWAADREIELSAEISPGLWQRQLSFVFDGLRARAATPLGQPPSTKAQLRHIGRERRERS